ncbi:hypothetical protein GOP47_0000201 [Adiantum capillus-veneris]|uniref:Uncharacterized protein n=1 Tax=Adiantum capillus-veneris TaxID=13818 RepID=A0A9D4VD49_ADICA|nr:hypothetical protein GOP47_0000201 [Adiantum capillus-veneris]
MAHQVNSPSSGLSSAQPQLIRVPPSISETPLDLNLSQKVSQSIYRGHDETDGSVSPRQSFETAASSQPQSVAKVASNVSTFNANGFVDFSARTVSKHTGEHKLAQSNVSGATPLGTLQSSSSLVQDVSLGVNELTPMSAGKRKSSRVEAASKVQKEQSQSATATLDDGISQAIEILPPSPEPKRKSPRVKQQTPDATKKVILALEANEDEGLPRSRGRPRGSYHPSKETVLDTPRSRSKSSSATIDAPSDLAERRLLLDERKVKLAEQRFALEEKKLEATIEIGKGLIISMERMTNTISGFGTSNRQHY